jgi:hypothetical protein
MNGTIYDIGLVYYILFISETLVGNVSRCGVHFNIAKYFCGVTDFATTQLYLQ